MPRVVAAAALIILAAGVAGAPIAGQAAVRVFVDGRRVAFDQPPVFSGSRVLVPLRGIFEEIGANVKWDASSRTVRAVRRETVIELRIGLRTARVNGRSVSLDAPATLMGGRTLVPLRFIGESLGARVDYRAADRTVLISSSGQPPTAPPIAAPPPHGPAPAPAPATTVTVTATDFKFTPDVINLTEGRPVTLALKNSGSIEHTIATAYFSTQQLTVRGHSEEGETAAKWKFVGVNPGGTAEITFTPRGRGRFQFICSVEGHAEAGMTGTVVVTAP